MSNERNVKKHKVFKLSILILLLIGMFFLKDENRDKLVSSINSFARGEKQIELVTSINTTRALNMKVYEDNIFVWEANKLILFDMEGSLKIEKQFNFEDPFLHFGDNYIYIGDKSTGDIYKLDKDGETIDRINFDKPFFNINEKNKTTIIHTKSNDGESVYIYDKDSVLIGNHSFTDKSIINYALGNSGVQYALSTLDLNENKLKSNMLLYGENNEELYSLDIDAEIILYSQFIKKDNIVVLTDKSLYSIKDGNIMWQNSFNLIKDIYIKDKIYILYSNYLESINSEGKSIEKVGFNKDYQKIIPFNRDILVYGNSGLNLISNEKEILSKDEDIDIIASSKKNIIILKNDKLDIYKVVKH